MIEVRRCPAEIDPVPECPVVDLDPRVSLVDDHARRDADLKRCHQEGEGSVTADALLRQGEIKIDVLLARGRYVGWTERTEVRHQLPHHLARPKPTGDTDRLRDLLEGR